MGCGWPALLLLLAGPLPGGGVRPEALRLQAELAAARAPLVQESLQNKDSGFWVEGFELRI